MLTMQLYHLHFQTIVQRALKKLVIFMLRQRQSIYIYPSRTEKTKASRQQRRQVTMYLCSTLSRACARRCSPESFASENLRRKKKKKEARERANCSGGACKWESFRAVAVFLVEVFNPAGNAIPPSSPDLPEETRQKNFPPPILGKFSFRTENWNF